MRHRHHDDPVRITSASRPVSEDIDHRQRRYLISMGIRTACFILTVVTYPHWYMWLFLTGAVFLPYIAVILANAGVSPDPGGPDPFDSSTTFTALPPGDEPGDES